MSRSRIRLMSVLAVGCTLCYVWWFSRPPEKTAPVRIGGVRNHHIERRRVAKFNVLLNGQPLLDHTHHIQMGKPGHFTGTVELHSAEIPSGMMFPSLYVSHYPRGTPEEAWTKRNSRHQWSMGLLGKDGKRRVEEIETPTSKYFSAGEHELRAYLYIRDAEGDKHAFDYLGKATLIVSE